MKLDYKEDGGLFLPQMEKGHNNLHILIFIQQSTDRPQTGIVYTLRNRFMLKIFEYLFVC